MSLSWICWPIKCSQLAYKLILGLHCEIKLVIAKSFWLIKKRMKEYYTFSDIIIKKLTKTTKCGFQKQPINKLNAS